MGHEYQEGLQITGVRGGLFLYYQWHTGRSSDFHDGVAAGVVTPDLADFGVGSALPFGQVLDHGDHSTLTTDGTARVALCTVGAPDVTLPSSNAVAFLGFDGSIDRIVTLGDVCLDVAFVDGHWVVVTWSYDERGSSTYDAVILDADLTVVGTIPIAAGLEAPHVGDDFVVEPFGHAVAIAVSNQITLIDVSSSEILARTAFDTDRVRMSEHEGQLHVLRSVVGRTFSDGSVEWHVFDETLAPVRDVVVYSPPERPFLVALEPMPDGLVALVTNRGDTPTEILLLNPESHALTAVAVPDITDTPYTDVAEDLAVVGSRVVVASSHYIASLWMARCRIQ